MNAQSHSGTGEGPPSGPEFVPLTRSPGFWAIMRDAAVACIAGMIGLLTGLWGLESAAVREMRGYASLSTSSRFALSFGRKNVDPVMLPSGLARLETRPVATASPLIAITMGIVVVACLAARVPGVP